MAVADHILFAFRNWADAGTYSGGSWVLPLTNLQHYQPTKKARSTGLYNSETYFDVDMGEVQPLRVFSLVAHNMSQSARWRVRVSFDDPTFASTLYDSGWVDLWPELIPFGVEDWGVFNWGQAIDDDELDFIGPYATLIADDDHVGQYVRVELDDPLNASGYVQAGRFIAEAGFQPQEANMAWNWSVATIDGTRESESLSGVRWIDRGPKRRLIRFDLDWLTDDEVLGQAIQMDRIVGSHGPLLVIPTPSDANKMLRFSVYGTLRRPLAPAIQVSKNRWRRTFEVEELI